MKQGVQIALVVSSGLIGVGAGWATYGLVPLPRRLIEAREFRLVDQFDRERARLSLDQAGAVQLRIFETGYANPITVTFDTERPDPSAQVAVEAPGAGSASVTIGAGAARAEVTSAAGAIRSLGLMPPAPDP